MDPVLFLLGFLLGAILSLPVGLLLRDETKKR